MSNSTERTKLRKQLLANGYRPLPLLDKGIRIRGWSTLDVTEQFIDEYKRNGKYANTGIRCDGLVAFDIDVYDEVIADDIEESIEDLLGQTDLCRVGRWPKRLLLYRLDGESIRSARTGKYEGHQVELLTGSGRQFAAYGIHPGTEEPYEWLEGHSPLNVPFDDLPTVTGEQATQMMEAIEALFESHGLSKDSPGSSIGSSGVKLYDLTDDTLFLHGGEVIEWSALKDELTEAGTWVNMMRENGEYGDSDGVHAYIAKGSQQPCVHDFPRDCTHFDEIISQDARKLFPDPPDDPVQLAPRPAATVLDDMVENWVLLFDKTARMVKEPVDSYKIDGLRLAFGKYTIAVPQLNGPDKQIPVVTEWLKHPNTLTAHTSQIRPDHPDEILFNQGEKTIFNTYRRPVHSESGGDLATLFEFVEHLIPDKTERELFYDWHAIKMLHPSYRLHGLIMVTETQGTGRNTWNGIVSKLLGRDYMGITTFKDLVGQGSQGDYNEYLANSLVIFTDEAKEDVEQGKWRTRHAAFEGLKQVVDTTPGRMRIKIKYGQIATVPVFASIVIATNHPDMLAIEDGDRRLVVLSNTRTRLVDAGDLNDRLRQWEADPANIGCLYRWLTKRALGGVKYDPFGAPMMTPAKQIMIDLSRNDNDTYYDMLVDSAPGAVITEHQLMRMVGEQYMTCGLSLPDDVSMTKRAVKSIWRKRAEVHPLHAQIRIGKHRLRPRIIRDFDHWSVTESIDDLKVETLLNGNPGGSVLKLDSNQGEPENE